MVPRCGRLVRQPGLLLAVGRLVPVKGLDMLLAALGRLVEGDADVELLVAGAGPLRSELEVRIVITRKQGRTALGRSARGLTRKPKATFSNTVMCRNRA